MKSKWKMTIVLICCVINFYYGIEFISRFAPEDIDKKETAEKEGNVLVLNNQTIDDVSVKKYEVKTPLPFLKQVSSAWHVISGKPRCYSKNKPDLASHLARAGITLFLLILLIDACLDVLRETRDEINKLKLMHPEAANLKGRSLAEFANKKKTILQRDSSKIEAKGFFQITKFFYKLQENMNRRQIFTRGESINSYFSERKPQAEGSAPASINETSEHKAVNRQSATKIIGARPVPMVRRSSFPALPLNRDVQAVMLGHRQQSVDSDDEGDGRGRRVRLIRRF